MIPDATDVFLDLAAGLLRTQTLRYDIKGQAITITADKEQYARLIGKQGRHILSLERIAKAFGYTLTATEPTTITDPRPARERNTQRLRDLLFYALAHAGIEAEINEASERGCTAYSVISSPVDEDLRDALEAILHSIARTDSRKISIAWLN